jgi:hypothetical protein
MSRTIRACTFNVIPSARTHRANARTAAALAAATVCSAVAFASPAAAAASDKRLAVDCPQPYSQKCLVRDGNSLTAEGDPPPGTHQVEVQAVGLQGAATRVP